MTEGYCTAAPLELWMHTATAPSVLRPLRAGNCTALDGRIIDVTLKPEEEEGEAEVVDDTPLPVGPITTAAPTLGPGYIAEPAPATLRQESAMEGGRTHVESTICPRRDVEDTSSAALQQLCFTPATG